MGQHQAPQRAPGRRGKIFTADPRTDRGGQAWRRCPADNPRLRLAVDKALTANMSRGSSTVPSPAALARTKKQHDRAELRGLRAEWRGDHHRSHDGQPQPHRRGGHAFSSKNGGNLGTDGPVAYMFDRKGRSAMRRASTRMLMEAALEAGADDVVTQGRRLGRGVPALPISSRSTRRLPKRGFKGDEAEVAMIPSIMAPITDVETAQKVLRLIDALEDLDDVQNASSQRRNCRRDHAAAELSRWKEPEVAVALPVFMVRCRRSVDVMTPVASGQAPPYTRHWINRQHGKA